MGLREVRELGRGSFGRVYLAFDEERGIQVAVKELLDPSSEIDRFAREVRLLAEQVNNVHVVTIFRAELSATKPYFVMEYCEGGSLRGLVGNVGWRTTATVVLQAAHGLLGIHSVGGFHRDVKPENILLALAKQGYIAKIGDLGLARRPTTVGPAMTRTPGGTEGYMAPELFVAGAEFTAAADIFSLGIVGIELITGSRAPHTIGDADAPAELKNLRTRMTSPSGWLRPTMVDVIVLLGRLLGGEPPATATPPLPPPQRPSSGGGAAALLVFGAALLGAAALAAGDRKKWDSAVGRYRGKDGKFRSG
jgi:serine/threonine protein kinase